MKVLLRADASVQIGSGHIMRCLTLAHALRQQGAECHFVCQQSEGNLIKVIEQLGFTVFPLDNSLDSQRSDAIKTQAALNTDYQLLIVDHYQLGLEYCQLLRSHCQYVLVIDDLANRQHDCDLLLDQNLIPNASSRYNHLVPSHCIQLLGPSYALLRDEFYQTKSQPIPQHILVSFGGSDEHNLTALAISAIASLKFQQVTADIVIGANNPWRTELEKQIASQPNMQLHVQCNYMAALMQKAQLMLGAGGASHWERCISRLPGLIVTVAENQQATTAYLQQLGACVWLGQAADMSEQLIAEKLRYYLLKPKRLDEISKAAATIVPITAGTKDVIKAINNLFKAKP
ncbi:UDP-2,4-diacetamido-2,4,6-trideoxy-beta-L-altropyranose hydrolase [Rheinheimera sp. WS51]|uniref:UDP-2,4-diacetamido-2,4, 6-trideoxy-beta-L-altropyranose hydrolase n=1 Tax=Rheinheimera sp. WS51 TaxID=3425886 RepID=UPI003D92F40D